MVRDDSSQQAAVTVIGRMGSPACYAIRDFLYRNDVPFQWVELRDDAQARALGLDGVSDERLPVCEFRCAGGRVSRFRDGASRRRRSPTDR